MGLVNLRNANVVVFSMDEGRSSELKSVLLNNRYKGVQCFKAVPDILAGLKSIKADILVVDNNLGDTKTEDFLKAISKAYSKIKVLVVLTKDKDGENYEPSKEVPYPLDVTYFVKTLEQAMMEKMGIASSAVTVDLKY